MPEGAEVTSRMPSDPAAAGCSSVRTRLTARVARASRRRVSAWPSCAAGVVLSSTLTAGYGPGHRRSSAVGRNGRGQKAARRPAVRPVCGGGRAAAGRWGRAAARAVTTVTALDRSTSCRRIVIGRARCASVLAVRTRVERIQATPAECRIGRRSRRSRRCRCARAGRGRGAAARRDTVLCTAAAATSRVPSGRARPCVISGGSEGWG